MERWVKSASGEGGQAQKPSVTHAQTIARRARQAATTKAGRKAALADRRQAMGRRGARLSITAMQGPRDPVYRRLRTVAVGYTTALGMRARLWWASLVPASGAAGGARKASE